MRSCPSSADLAAWRAARQLRVATVGRRTGLQREKWWLVFAIHDDTIYLLEEAGGRADWVRNIVANPNVQVWVDGHDPVRGVARIVTDQAEITTARQTVAATPVGSTLQDLVEWGLPIAIEFQRP